MSLRMLGRLVSPRVPALLAPLLLSACGDDGPTDPPVYSLEVLGPAALAGAPLDTLAELLTVRVTDALGRPAGGVRVTWSTADGGTLLPESPETDEAGLVRAAWILGWRPGQQEAGARVAEGRAADFTATARGFEAIGLSLGDTPHQCGIVEGGALFCWGPNDLGQLGDGTTTSSEVPVAVQLDEPVLEAVTGGTDAFTCALTVDGDVWCWGGNDHGQLGVGTLTASLEPVRPQLPPGRYTDLSAEGAGACALAESGDAYCWGHNRDGRFGAGHGEPSVQVPARVAADFAWRQVELGDDRSCGVRQGGQVYCWGSRPDWLGIGGDTTTVLPVPVQNAPPMDSVTLSGWHQCGLTADQVTYCWGANHNIGFESTEFLIPHPVALETPPHLRSAHSTFKPTYALGTDGKGYWWGPAPDATGDGPKTPVPFSGGIPLRAIGTYHRGVCGTEESTGTVYCWVPGIHEIARVFAVPPAAGGG